MLRLELKIIGLNLLWVTTLVFSIFLLLIVTAGDNIDIVTMFFEIFMPMYMTIVICEVVKIKTDHAIENLLVNTISYFRLVLRRYSLVFSVISIMTILYMFIINIFFKDLNVADMILTFLSPSLFLSSFSLVFSFVFNNGISGSVAGGLLWIVNLSTRGLMQKWPFIVVFLFASLFQNSNYVWIINKISLILVSILLWIIIYIICHKRTFLYD